ncbi:7-deoxyloganetic acid glucosyltransferase-like protein [Tanacetum coccineum]|uniref:Glycosyltransferase n=1 Tax=Tanacetum coccineum TaxID=301880 RepID=A0ABQ5J2M8_9ASTR
MEKNHQKGDSTNPLEPHVLIFPIPIQGPVNCFLKLAELLCLSGIYVTFLNTDHIHRPLLRHTNILSRFSRYPNFRFETIRDGVDFENPVSAANIKEVIEGANVVSKPLFREMMIYGRLSRRSERPVTVMILDAFFSFAVEVGLETSTPVFCFQTISPCCSWTCFFNLSTLIEAGEVPFKEEDMDKLVENVPGTQHLLRKRDLAGFCRLDDMSNGEIQRVLKEALLTPRTQGSLAMMKFEQLLEIWYGLVNSGKPFLWVRRPGSISEGYDESHVSSDLLDHTKEMGCIVDWAPQEDVLAHEAIGAFMTHSGWNSTMESIAVGVPMICWPYFYDQQVISRFVGEVWKVGVDIKDTCDRLIVEKAIRDVMDNKRDIFIQSATLWENLAKESISKAGSSSKSLARLVADIISVSSTVK